MANKVRINLLLIIIKLHLTNNQLSPGSVIDVDRRKRSRSVDTIVANVIVTGFPHNQNQPVIITSQIMDKSVLNAKL